LPRLARVLPHLAPLLVVIGILVIFRAILMPFALAVFLAYMLYPIVRMIERLPIGRGHPPRWLVVILIYAAMFTVGWMVVPAMAVRVASDLGGLKETVPAIFGTFRTWQEQGNTKIERWLEVRALPPAIEDRLQSSLDRLQDGTLVPPPLVVGEPEHLRLAGDPADTSGATIPSRPPSTAAEAAPSLEEPPAGTPGVPEDDGSSDANATTRLRFSDESKAAFWNALRETITAELEAEGRARGVPERLLAHVPVLGEKHTALPRGDDGLLSFARIVENQVRAALGQEEFADVIRQAFDDAFATTLEWVTDLLRRTTLVVTRVIAGTFDFFLVLMLTAFFLIFFARIRDYLRDIVPPQYRDDYTAVLQRIDARLSGAVRGQVIICLVNGLLTYVGLSVIGNTSAPLLAQYAALLSVIAGVLSLIPIFGVILSTVPMLLFALTQSVFVALAVVGWISVIHAIEAYLLNPHILGHSARMNPILVVFALLAGKHVGGLLGALLAVPIAAVVVAMFGYYRRRLARAYAAEAGLEAPEDHWGD
jgi:predicted PurR-regulated permease PerM